MKIDAILFDADGVVQRPFAARRDAWLELLGSGRDVDKFVAAIFEVEELALEGQADFIEGLSSILAEWGCQGTVDDALVAWTMIEVDAEIAEIVRSLRRGGLKCCLATNQEPHRADYMSAKLRYAELFDKEFYSCRMGVMKPAGAYFRAILNNIDIPAGNVLFLDDHRINVDAARETGIHAAEFRLEAGLGELVRILRSFEIHVV